ncbi:hypothetical protein Ddye_002428 [Dipteronia dyeriana]|uniref:Uncharacterized protein n=1 Tax=Dipteronia dyeriana TaxID=168575 RepID=A0AAD9XQD3_9ROSI|nr:hypothetical protein Ddye_002428 [Dipteronia dyeriana]
MAMRVNRSVYCLNYCLTTTTTTVTMAMAMAMTIPPINWSQMSLKLSGLSRRKKKVSVRIRLYVHGTILGYRRSKSNQYSNTPLIQIDGVKTKQEVTWYVGKRITYRYKAETEKNAIRYHCICGKVTRYHGNNCVARARFKSNLPPKLIGRRVH